MSIRAKVAVIICGLVLFGATASATPAKKASRKPAVPKKVEQQPAPAPAPVIPQPPPTLAEQPAVAPNVAMNNGLLTITADNSTLSDVLSGVKRATGASMDVPSAAASERVVVHLGPGEPPDVLRQLLTGSKFDYIIIGSPQNASAVQRVILTARGAAGAVSGPQATAQQPAQKSYQPPEEPVEDDSSNEPPQPEPTPEVTLPPQPPPGQSAQPGQAPQQNGPKTPEQLLQELQQMQQQQRPDRNPRPN